jgi:hypothetical protein
VKRWKERLSKIDPAPELVVTPYPPPNSLSVKNPEAVEQGGGAVGLK